MREVRSRTKTHTLRYTETLSATNCILDDPTMGWNLRRSINFGPVRMNLSKSGVGYSVGIRGFRVGRDSKGRKYRAVSIPSTGIYRRDYFQPSAPSSHASQSLPPAISSPIPVLPRANNRAIGAGAKWGVYAGGAVLLYAVIRFLS